MSWKITGGQVLRDGAIVPGAVTLADGRIAAAAPAIAAGEVHLLGFNDHTPGIMRRLEKPAERGKYAGRAGVGEAEFMALAKAATSRRADLPALRARLAQAARIAGIPMLSHDDATFTDRAMFRALGAPNVVRGGSHLGWASAAPLAERGLVTVLASDYHWPALLAAPFRMAARGVLNLEARACR